MTNQEILDKIKTINTAMGLSGFYKWLLVHCKINDKVLEALKARRKEL